MVKWQYNNRKEQVGTVGFHRRRYLVVSRTNLIDAEQYRGLYFLRLANALSVLYPQGCNEKRLLNAMLLAVPR